MTWFQIKNMAEGESRRAEINIFAEIGYDWWDGSGTTAKGFIDAVNALGDLTEIVLNINSPGGDVYDGLTIYNYLKAHDAKVIVNVMGMAASIASVIAMAADDLNMPANTMLMIHDPMSYTAGNADEMRKMAETLDKVKEGLVSAYVDKTGMSAEEIGELMSKETYLTAKEALEYGFADSQGDDVQIVNSHDMKQIRAAAEQKAQSFVNAQKDKQIVNLNEQLTEARAEIETLKNPTPPAKAEAKSIITACKAAKFTDLSVALIQRELTDSQVTAQIERAEKIRNVCTAASLGDSVMAIVNEADPVEMVRVAITETQAVLDQDINNQHSPRSGVHNGRAIDSKAIYSKRKQGN